MLRREAARDGSGTPRKAGPLSGGSVWIVALAAAFGVASAAVARVQAIDYDGWWHAFYARQTWRDFRAEIYSDAHPPLYYLLLRIPASFARGRLAYCSISIVAGAAAVCLMGAIGSQFPRRWTGALASFATVASISALSLSANVRSYMLALALMLVSLLGFVRFFEDDSRERRNIAMIAGGSVFALLTDSVVLFFIAAIIASGILLYLLAAPDRRMALRAKFRRRAGELGAAAAMFAASLVVMNRILWRKWKEPLDFLLNFYFDPRRERPGRFLSSAIPLEGKLFSPFGLSGRSFVLLVGSATALLLAAGIAAWRRGETGSAARIAAPALLALTFAALVAAALLRKYPLGGEMRHQSILLPLLILVFTGAADAAASFFPRAAAGIAVAAFAGAGLHMAREAARFRAPRAGIAETTAAVLDAGPPLGKLVYADQFSFIPAFAALERCDWVSLAARPEFRRYAVSCGGVVRTIERHLTNWNQPISPALIERMRNTARDQRCATCFHVDQLKGLRGQPMNGVGPVSAGSPFWVFEVCRP